MARQLRFTVESSPTPLKCGVASPFIATSKSHNPRCFLSFKPILKVLLGDCQYFCLIFQSKHHQTWAPLTWRRYPCVLARGSGGESAPHMVFNFDFFLDVIRNYFKFFSLVFVLLPQYKCSYTMQQHWRGVAMQQHWRGVTTSKAKQTLRTNCRQMKSRGQCFYRHF